jgi:hypothetical protein
MNRQVQTLFCDDIRHEVGGKLSYIGVYSGALFVTSFPVSLPKLCLALSVITPMERPLRSLSIRVMKDDAVLAEATPEDSQLVNATESLAELPDDERKERVQVLKSHFVFSPLHLEGPCTLRVRVQTEDEELRGGDLRIDQLPAPQLAGGNLGRSDSEPGPF